MLLGVANLVRCLCACALLGGCEAPSQGADTPAVVDTDAAFEVTDAAALDRSPRGTCTDLPDLTGRVYRVTDFVATAPTDGLNSTWKKWADVYDLVMMFRILDHDRDAGWIKAVVACGGAEVSEGPDGAPIPERLFYGLEPTPIFFNVDGCDLTFDEPLDIHLFTPWVSDEIPILDVTGAGTLSGDGSEIEHLALSGFLSEATASAICIDMAGIGVLNLHWFFNTAAICPDVDIDGDGILDAYNFLGWVRAVDETPLFDEDMEPIESLVPECPTNEEPCVIPQGG